MIEVFIAIANISALIAIASAQSRYSRRIAELEAGQELLKGVVSDVLKRLRDSESAVHTLLNSNSRIKKDLLAHIEQFQVVLEKFRDVSGGEETDDVDQWEN